MVAIIQRRSIEAKPIIVTATATVVTLRDIDQTSWEEIESLTPSKERFARLVLKFGPSDEWFEQEDRID